MIEKVKDFWREARVEIKKVTWPDRKATTASTVVVLAVVAIVSVYLGVVDALLSQLGDGGELVPEAVDVLRLLRQFGEDPDVRGDPSDAVMEVHDDVFLLPGMAFLLPDPFLIEPNLFILRMLAVGDVEERGDGCRSAFIVDDPCGG
ncbi:MAG: preprotein translocase subunit SecE [Nitrospiraceae bacterium]|nr:preprotein translocase subunit SecE [Nitrospiraceae bacterium]